MSNNEELGDNQPSVQTAMEDANHTRVSLTSQGFVLPRSMNIRPHVALNSNAANREFNQQIRTALHREYNVTHVVSLTNKSLKWYQRIAFTDPVSQRLRVLSVDDFITINGRTARLLQVLSMPLRNYNFPFTFVVVQHMAEAVDEDDNQNVVRDPLLGMCVNTAVGDPTVYGLPALEPELRYISHVRGHVSICLNVNDICQTQAQHA